MAYVTVAQLKEALANAGGAGARTAAALPDPRLQANLDEAAGEVVGRLTHSFKIPDPGDDPLVSPDTIPALMRTIIIGIAGYLATLEFYGTQEVQERDPVVLRYTRAKELLDQVAKGTLIVAGLETLEGDTGSLTGEPAIFQPPGGRVGLADVFDPSSYDGRHNTPAHYGGAVWE